MNQYRIYGGRLRSDVPFAELTPVTPVPGDGAGPGDRFACTLRRGQGAGGPEGTPVGELSIDGAGELRLFGSGRTLRLVHDRSGTYEIDAERGLIEWRPSEDGPSPEILRSVVLTQALPLLLHLHGLFPLHASGVGVDGRALGFAGPKGHGKSTLALAMASRGAELLSDDTIPVEVGPPPRAWPGDRHMKVWDDAAETVGVAVPERSPLAKLGPEQTVSGDEKRKYLLASGDLPDLRWVDDALPVAALYLLVPTTPDAEGEVDEGLWVERSGAEGSRRAAEPRRIRLSDQEAAPALVACSKVAPLLHRSDAGVLLERATDLVQEVPVFAIPVPRDLDRLAAVCDRIQRWHGSPTGRTAGPSERRP